MRAQGYACISDPDSGIKETDTITCCHCNRVVHIPPGKVETVSDFCRSCMKMICITCAGKGCVPFLRKLEQEEARHHARRSYV